MGELKSMWPESILVRDTGLHDDFGGAGKRIYTTAGGLEYERRKYVMAPTATNAIWINTVPDQPNLRIWPRQPGRYWVMISGDSETDGPHVFYQFDDYRTQFTIVDYDEETGVPMGAGDQDEEWDTVIAYWQPPIIEPKPWDKK